MKSEIWGYFFSVIGVFLILTNSCKKEEVKNNNSTVAAAPAAAPATYSLSATIDSVPYVATSFSVSTISGKIGISGMNGTKNLILWLPDTFSTGAHSLSYFGNYMAQYNPNSTTSHSSGSGTIDITEYNSTSGKIKGTFNFQGFTTTINVTNGLFEVYK